jgi:hypothetical protein
VPYPAGKYDSSKTYISTDVKSPYVTIGEDYYLLKESVCWRNNRCYYDEDSIGKSATYKYMSIDPEDLNDSNTYITPIGANGANAYTNGIYHFCATGCTNSTFFKPNAGTGTSDNRWKYFMPTVDAAKAVLVNGKKYIKQFYKTGTSSHPGWDGYVGHVVWTLNHDKTEVILASKFIYSTDGTPENVVEPPTGASVPTQTPDENFASPVGLKIWEKFESFEAIYAKIAMIDNGTIGSAVYSGDFMFSQQGVDKNGNASPHFENFNPEHIYDSESTFKPNICMNFKTGEMYASGGNIEFSQNNINLSGYMTKKISYINSADDLVKYCYLDNFDVTGTRSMLIDILKTGSLICFNYMPNSSSSTSAGEMTVKLPRMRQYANGAPSWVKNNDGTIDFNQINLCRMISETQILIYNNDTTHTSSNITLNGPLYSETDYYHSNGGIYDNGSIYGYTEANTTSITINSFKVAPVSIDVPIPKLKIDLSDWKSKRSPGILPENVNRNVSVFKGEFISLTPKIVSSQDYEDVVWIYSKGKHPGGF